MKLHIAFRVGTADYVIPTDDVVVLESFTEATPVPGAPSFVAGLVQSRGKLLPVVDLRARFGLPATERTLDHRVIVVRAGERTAGLLVDSARDIVRLDEATYEPPPELVSMNAAGFVKAVTTTPPPSRLLLVLDVPRVLGEEVTHG